MVMRHELIQISSFFRNSGARLLEKRILECKHYPMIMRNLRIADVVADSAFCSAGQKEKLLLLINGK